MTRWLASASVVCAGVLAAATITVPAQASAHGGAAAGLRPTVPGAVAPLQNSLLDSKPYRSLPIPASGRRLDAIENAGSANNGNELGHSVAVSANGEVAAVSAQLGGVGGLVYIYVQRAGSWKRVQTLQPAPPIPQATFGGVVGLSGTGSTLIARGEAADGDSAVFIFTRSQAGKWVQSAVIGGTSAQPSGWGASAAISGSGSEVLVGDPVANSYAGAAYLYQETSGGTWQLTQTWNRPSKITGTWFGWDVALSAAGTTALVSDYLNNVDAVAVYHESAGSWKEVHEFSKSGTGQSFGVSLALSEDGSTAIVGAPQAGSNKGVAYVYGDTNNSWSPTGKLSPSDSAAGDYFGSSVALSKNGTTALVGAEGTGAPGGPAYTDGAAYLFTGAAGTWSQQAEMTASDGQKGDGFGYAVALSPAGSTAVIGAPYANEGSGEAYAFQGPGSSWAQQAAWNQAGPNAEDEFGGSVAVSASGGTAVVGAQGNEGSTGAVYVYTHRHSGRWARAAELTASNPLQGDGFGEDVTISGDGSTIAVESRNSISNTAPKRVYIFDRTSTGWAQSAELAAPAKDGEIDFGWDLSLSSDGSSLAVGSLTAGSYAWYFTRQQDGSWKLAHQFTGSEGHFGLDVALSSDASTLLIGEYGGEATTHIGAVVVYAQSGGKWAKSATLRASNGETYNDFGMAIAVSADGSRAVIAAPGVNSDQGAMYVFSRNSKGQWHQVSDLTASDGQSGDALGFSPFCPCTIGLTASGTTAVVGAQSKAGSAGAAYVFSTSSGKPWSQASEFTSSPDYTGNQMGYSNGINANATVIVVGAPGTADSSGGVYIYTSGSTGWTLAQTLLDPGTGS
jgi:hypothetical protein